MAGKHLIKEIYLTDKNCLFWKLEHYAEQIVLVSVAIKLNSQMNSNLGPRFSKKEVVNINVH